MTQNERLLDYLMQGNYVNGLSAWTELSIYRLSAIVFNLRQAGIVVSDRRVDSINKFGEKVNYKEYYLTATERERIDNLKKMVEIKLPDGRISIKVPVEQMLKQLMYYKEKV